MAKKETANEKKKKKLPPGVRERGGRYTYRYSVEVVVEGKVKRKQKETPSYPTAKEAYDAGILIAADKQRGKLVDEKNITFGVWKEKWLKSYEAERDPRKYTQRGRETALKSLEGYVGENKRLKDITVDDYQEWLLELKREGKKQNTIRQYHAGARMMFADAVRKNIIAESPAEKSVLPVFKQTLEEIESGEFDVPKFLEQKELKHFLQLVRFRGEPQEYAIFVTLAYTGIRIGELMALKVSDFNEKERTLSITKTLTILSSVKNYHLGPPKSKSSIRKVSIGETVIKALKAQLAWRNQKTNDKRVKHDSDFIFWSPKYPGYPLRPDGIWRRFKLLAALAELPDSLTPHSLRHTHVSLLAAGGEQLAVIQERLGHRDDGITKRIYLHVTKEQQKLVPDRFEKIMN
ncbi:tyrosine-type recombinase/integrase [Paenibacillus sp. GCM10027626]|uniref:tyrosine-type recombinase/integrase n=1 Tax=Paenibacillus sp. GCM10027626 TaxID=3273411 RepID=UPI00362D6EF0